MSLITKPYTFSAGQTILSSETNANNDIIFSDYNGNITNANLAVGAAIGDTKLAQITTPAKVSGAALTSLGSIPQQTTTTGNALLIDSDTLTTGSLALFDSNSSDTGTRSLVSIVNDNTLATGATGLSIQQDAAQNAVVITHTAITGNALTITASQTTANIVDISVAALTTGKAIDLSNFSAITTGKAIHIDATGVTHTDGILVHIDSGSTAITSTGRLLLVDHTANAGVSTIIAEVASAAADETVVMRVTASAALALGNVLDLSATALTTGTVLDMGGLDALTTGTALNIVSNSSSASTRVLVQVTNDHTSADAATCLAIQQDGDAVALYIDYNATASDTLTGLRIDGCNSTGAVTCTLGTNGPAGIGTTTPTTWLHINVNGTMHYLPMWT